ncbi:MAG: M56 family metallopeptidase [Candidatus Sulfopaludibacter sp.]|nr:M56 family metallopeptidase [Candidatus Sulfopaludibacter sp.]
MNLSLAWDNVVTYSLQVGLLVGLTAFIPALLRLRQPQAKLWFWYLLLVTCLALPALRPWKQEIVTASVQVPPPSLPTAPLPPVKHTMPRSQMALLVLAAGAAFRLAWLAAGFWKLRRYRRHSRPLAGPCAWRVEADLRISEDINSPVTFGFLDPVILLPGQFPELDQAKQDAILCHEVLHVWRHDWLFAIGEELVRAAFWFHPAIWWLLGEIQLAREQAVDREVIDLTSKRDEYLDALLAIAGAAAVPDLAPAPLFLRKRHLKQRVVSILKEVRMSKTRLISAFAMSLIMLAGACWFVTGAFPLAAEPQMVSDAVGVSVTVNDPLIHRGGVMYPSAALQARIEGTVVVQLRLGSKGEVVDASVLSGPDELRKGVLTSVLDWHFTRDVANSTRQVSINFQLPKAETVPATATAETSVQAPRQAAAGGVVGGVPGGVSGGVRSGVLGGMIMARQSTAPPIPGTVKAIATPGLSDQARRELLSRLPVHEGDTITPELFRQTGEAVREYDEHLNLGVFGNSGETTLQISAPHQAMMSMGVGMPVADLPVPPGAIRVGGNVQQSKLTSQVRPAYPPMAKDARIQGVVHLFAVIGKDGGVKSLTVISGHPLLIGAAMEAVRQWTYETTLLNGAPVEVATQIDVNFTLSE